ncbi:MULTISPECIES: cation:proton antiporter [Nocardia]|uniref:cation:proton antiporter domain-containing protein n=1 Tax=Nocardia TaxID=1817 RepID=UPI0024582AD7|nr:MULTISPECIES: cation:proton antiporter [Nocardia]
MAASYLPFVPQVHLEPEIVLLGLLPPLLYTAALRTSLVDFRAEIGTIALLSVGLVLFSTFAVAAVVWWLLPVPFAVAVALGAVVATAVARRIGMPRRTVTLLEAESLFNDATALVALRTASAAAAGTVSLWQAGGSAIGCCEFSPGNHTAGHFAATGHPGIRSVEPGEAWRWCYRDDLIG